MERFHPGENEGGWGEDEERTAETEATECEPFPEAPPTSPQELYTIEWPDGSVLRVIPSERRAALPTSAAYELRADSRACDLIYIERGKAPVKIAEMTSPEHAIDFIGADSFWAFDSDIKVSGKERTSTVAVSPKELERHQQRMVAVYHEVGHTFLYEGMDELLLEILLPHTEIREALLDEPRLGGLKPYFEKLLEMEKSFRGFDLFREEMIDGSRKGRKQQTRELIAEAAKLDFSTTSRREYLQRLRNISPDFHRMVKIFHERMAWAFAMKQMRKQGVKFGYKSNEEIVDYAERCLGTYSSGDRDQRYNDGVAKR